MLTYQLDEHVTLKLVDPNIADAVFAVVEANRDHLRTFLSWVEGTTEPANFAAFAQRVRHDYADNKIVPMTIFWDDAPVGGIGISKSQAAGGMRNCSIGYWLAADYQGRGIITRACRTLISFAFTEWDANRITIQCATANTRSCAVPERLGFTREGILRQSHWINSVYQDMAIYSLLANEWVTNSSTD